MTHPTPSDAIIEAAARAIHKVERERMRHWKSGCRIIPAWSTLLPEQKELYTEKAKAALQAALAHQHQDAEVVGEKTHEELIADVRKASQDLLDYCDHNIVQFLGWGEGNVPNEATQWYEHAKAIKAVIDNPTAWNANMDEAPRDGTAFYVWWPHWYHFPLIAYWDTFQLHLADSTQPAPPWQSGEPNGPEGWKPMSLPSFPQPPKEQG